MSLFRETSALDLALMLQERSDKRAYLLINKINENSPSLYRWEMNRKTNLASVAGRYPPLDMRSKTIGQPDKMVA